ncbi:13539_t:CDS:2 [Funneliformis geosporum]|uniref:13539_t:CDS:1 n=1 Tax=Funneliformis geosporum TaxID=1117311 RepID=A0A9W4SAJ1_9GLOM|nr:13539_t:CDS:2 [Funneliformis geosporum]
MDELARREELNELIQSSDLEKAQKVPINKLLKKCVARLRSLARQKMEQENSIARLISENKREKRALENKIKTQESEEMERNSFETPSPIERPAEPKGIPPRGSKRNEELTSELKEAREKIAKLEEENEGLKKEGQENEKLIRDGMERIERLKKFIKRQQTEESGCNDSFHIDLEKEIKAKISRIEKLESRLLRVEKENKDTRFDKKQLERELRERTKYWMDTLETLFAKIPENSELSAEIARLKAELASNEKSPKLGEECNIEEHHELSDKNLELQARIMGLMMSNEHLQEVIKQLKKLKKPEMELKGDASSSKKD